ncbi:MAG TPA: hypothetical protein VFO21_14865, partial [Vicinamibacterales bacterium]|nr:hypothetical protein [Vicinamibacterales bacterium]
MRRLIALASVFALVSAADVESQARGAGSAPGAGAPPQGRGRAAGPGYPKFFDSNTPFNARDLAGIWTPNGAGFGGGGRCRDCGDRG